LVGVEVVNTKHHHYSTHGSIIFKSSPPLQRIVSSPQEYQHGQVQFGAKTEPQRVEIQPYNPFAKSKLENRIDYPASVHAKPF